MGGDREFHTESKDKVKDSAIVTSKDQMPEIKTTESSAESSDNVRIHESNGQVHFHDDARQMKVAVPVAAWWKAWEGIRKPEVGITNSWSYADPENSSVLLIDVTCSMSESGSFLISVDIQIYPAVIGNNFSHLDKFTRK